MMHPMDATLTNESAEAEALRIREKHDAIIRQIRLTGKDWRKGIGMLTDTPQAREADRRAAEWRAAQMDP
jgi:hypothetical protein